MVFRGQLDGRTTLASVKDTSVSLAVGSHWIAAWDLAGRLYSLWKHGHTYRRGLNGRVLHKWADDRGAGGPPADPDRGTGFQPVNPYDARVRVNIEGAEAHACAGEAAAVLRRAIDSMAREASAWSDGTGRHHPDADVLDLFRRCAEFDARRSEEDAARFATVFSPVGILPPDQYLSIVVQATEGCSFGTCTFCDLYHQRYRVKSLEEFRAHVEAVRDFLGESALLRGRSVFLGAANALAVPTPRLLAFFETIEEVFGATPAPPTGGMPTPTGGTPTGGTATGGTATGGTATGGTATGGTPVLLRVHAFVDGFAGLRKSADDYAALAGRGLRRVYIGLESGHDPLLAFVRKPATRDEAVETVRAIKAGGVAVGVIVMVGLGGRRFAAGHVADTTRAINAMRLDAGDLLYFSDLVEVPGTLYPQLAASEGVRPLALDERLEQIAAIRDGLRFPGPPPRAARYDVREFVY